MRIEDPVVREASPASKLVYVTLQSAEEPLAQHEIVTRTALNERYVRRRLDELEDAGVIETVSNVQGDLRERHYRVPE
jgi:DNA-binding IscR family transcriptional regulator